MRAVDHRDLDLMRRSGGVVDTPCAIPDPRSKSGLLYVTVLCDDAAEEFRRLAAEGWPFLPEHLRGKADFLSCALRGDYVAERRQLHHAARGARAAR